jgi:hypothetical protein
MIGQTGVNEKIEKKKKVNQLVDFILKIFIKIISY